MESKQTKKSYGIFEIEHFDLPGGDIADFPIESREQARELAMKTLKSDKECMNYMPGHNKGWHKNIDKCEKVKQYHSEDTDNGETIRIDQNGLLYGLGTDLGTTSWENPYLSAKVGVNFSKDACNYYSTVNGHQENNVEDASSIIVENSHRGANATQYSDPKEESVGGNAWCEINYADFCSGDESNTSCNSYEEALQMLFKKPKKSNIAYQWWKGHQKMYTKPTNRGAFWTNEHANNDPGQCHLFVWGQTLDFEIDGMTLVTMDNVDTGGGPSDGHIDHNVTSEQQALELIKGYKNPKSAYFWCSQSNRLIEKSPSKRCGKWNSQKGVFFVYVNKVHGDPHQEESKTPDECQELFDALPEELPKKEPQPPAPYHNEKSWEDSDNKPEELKNGFSVRYSKEIGGDKNTTHEIFEWPSNEFLGNMTKEEFENFQIDKIMWVKGTHFGEAEDYCNSLRFVSNTGEESPLFSDKDPNAEIDVSQKRIANIYAKTNYHHAFCYKFCDDLQNTIEKPVYSKYDQKGEDGFRISIGFDEKLVGLKVQLSDWVDCKISKISFKIAKCSQKGINTDDIKLQIEEKKVSDLKMAEEVEAFLKKTDFGNQPQCYFITKHDGDEFIQHNHKDGTYEAYKLGTDEKVDSGKWKVEGSSYCEKGSEWKGQFQLLGNDHFVIDMYCGEHGYHQYYPTKDHYIKGQTQKMIDTKKEMESLPHRGNSWCEINYADFCSGDESNESIQTYKQALQTVMKKPKKNNVAYQWWKEHKRMYTKPTNKGANFTDEHAGNRPGQCHLFVWGQTQDFEIDEMTLVTIDNVIASGGKSDGHIDENVTSEEQALELIKQHKNSKSAYFWCNETNRLIEKPPSKRCGKWNSQKGVFFMYANKIHGDEDTSEEGKKYANILMKQYAEVFGILCAQEWKNEDGLDINFFDDGTGAGSWGSFTWIMCPNGEIVINAEHGGDKFTLSWQKGSMILKSSDGDNTWACGAKTFSSKKPTNFYVPEFIEGVGFQEKDYIQWKPKWKSDKGQIFQTQMIGSKSYLKDTGIQKGPVKLLESLQGKEESEIKALHLTKVEWREWCDNGIMEGLKFHWSDGSSTQNFGESSRGLGMPSSVSFTGDNQVKSICIFHDLRYVTGLQFYNCIGEQIGDTVGKPCGAYSKGEVRKDWVGIQPNQQLVGVQISHANDPGDGAAIMIGQIGFQIATTEDDTLKNEYVSYSGKSLNWNQTKEIIDEKGGQMMTLEEAQDLIKRNSKKPFFPGEDQWAAVVASNGDKDWVQLGNKHHTPGKSHSEYGYPDWGNKAGHFVWRNCIMFKQQKGQVGLKQPLSSGESTKKTGQIKKGVSWFEIDLKENRFTPTHYVYRGDMGGGENHPRNFALQGSADGIEYTDLKVHENDKSIKKIQNGSWDIIDSKGQWRFLRIQNQGSPKHLCCSGIEFYGTLLEKSGKMHEFKWMRECPKPQEKHTSYMYFVAEEIKGAPVPSDYSLCLIPNIDLQHGDLEEQKCKSDEGAAEIAGKMLKDPKNYVFWFSDINRVIYKEITSTKLGKGYGGGSFFLGKKISSDVSHIKMTTASQVLGEFELAKGSETIKFGGSEKAKDDVDFDKNGLLYAIGTDFGKSQWQNPFKTEKVGVNFSEDACNYYSTDNGHERRHVEKSSSIIVDNAHRGANATMWSEGKSHAWFELDLKDLRLMPTHYSYRGDAGGGENHPRSWALQGSQDGEKYFTLSQHNDDTSVQRHQKGCWNIAGSKECWRFLRIQNLGKPKHLCCSGIEFYGTLGKDQVFTPNEESQNAKITSDAKKYREAVPGGEEE